MALHKTASGSPGQDASARKHTLFGFELEELQGSRAPSYLSTGSGRLEVNDEAEYQPLVDREEVVSPEHPVTRHSLTEMDIPKAFHQSLVQRGKSASSRQSSLTTDATPETSHPNGPEPSSRKKRRKLEGWRFGLVLNSTLATFVLIANVILITVAAYKSDMIDSIGSLYVGDCGVVDEWNTGIHVLINVLSSILLSASNYAMQCVTSPTRSECDAAHARGDWLDIGVAGTRNLKRISYHRRVVWALLALTSLPIHLLYNSAVFKTLDANAYRYAVVGDEFLDAPALNSSQLGTLNQGMETTRQQYHEDPSAYERLSAETCISAYGGPFVSGYSNLLLVTNDQYDASNPRHVVYDIIWLDSNGVSDSPLSGGKIWLCDDLSLGRYCDASDIKSASDWTVRSYKIDHCLARKTEPRCKLQFSLHILVAVIACNLVKSACMFWTLFRQRETTLVTFGDALATWLDSPDEHTGRRCLMGKQELLHSSTLERARTSRSKHDSVHTWRDVEPLPVSFSDKIIRRWSHAVSSKRWSVTMGFCIVVVIVACILLGLGINGSIYTVQNPIVELGFGSFNPNAIINIGLPQLGTTGLIGCVLIANLPQVVLSISYVMYNGLYTCMHLAHEYSGYAAERKPLRVTEPKGTQRSTYWLQLPYTYGMPLIAASATLHWLVSQSIFLARVTVWRDSDNETPVYAPGRNDYEGITASAVGYSCAPLLCVILLGIVMLFAAVMMGLRKLPGHVPIAGSCSAAIAAAAHRPESDVDASVLPVKWGVVTGSSVGEVGHVCFTSEDVTYPRNGQLYAGTENQLHAKRQQT